MGLKIKGKVLGKMDFSPVPNLKMFEKWLQTFLLNAKCHEVPSSPDMAVNLLTTII